MVVSDLTFHFLVPMEKIPTLVFQAGEKASDALSFSGEGKALHIKVLKKCK